MRKIITTPEEFFALLEAGVYVHGAGDGQVSAVGWLQARSDGESMRRLVEHYIPNKTYSVEVE